MTDAPHSKVEFGHIGAGTPHARMQRLWTMMHEYDDLTIHYTDYNPISSVGLFEDSFMDLFKFLLTCAEREGYVKRRTVVEAIQEQQAAWERRQ